MAINPYSSIFGLEEEDEEEEALRLAEEAAAAEAEEAASSNPYASILSGVVPEAPEPEAVTVPEEEVPAEPSWFDRAVAPSGGSFTGGPVSDPEDVDTGFFSDMFKRSAKEAVNVTASLGESAAIESVEARRDAGERGDVAGAMGLPATMSSDPFTSFMAERTYTPKEQEEVLSEARQLGLRDILDQPTAQVSEAMRAWADEKFPTDSQYDDTFAGKTAGAMGSLAPFVVSSLFSPVLTAALGASANGSAQFRDAIMTEGATFEEALAAANAGNAVGLLEMAPVEFAFTRLDKATGGWFSRTVTDKVKSNLGKLGVEGAAGAAAEALQESITQYLNNFSARDLIGYDEERKLLEGTGEAAGIAVIPGFLMNTVAGGVRMRKQANQENRTLEALVPNLPESLARQEATESLDPNRAQAYVPSVEQELDFGLPDVGITIGKQNIQRQEVGVSGNVTLGEGSALKRVKELAADPSKMLEQDVDVKLPIPAVKPKEPAQEAPAERPFTAVVEENENVVQASDPDNRGSVFGALSSDGQTLKIRQSEVDEDLRGQGIGPELYRQLFDDQLRKGRTIQTDDSVSAPAFKVWQKLQQEGYAVEISPALESFKDQKGDIFYDTTDGSPVATLRPEQAAEQQAPVEGDYFIQELQQKQEELSQLKDDDPRIDRIMGSDWAYTGQDWQSLTKKQKAERVLAQRISQREQHLASQAGQQQEFGDEGVQVEELTPEQLEQELGQPEAAGTTELFRGFHDAPVGEVQIGDLGAHFTPNRDVAASKTGETGQVGEYDADIQNPLRLEEPEGGAWHDPARVVAVLRKAGVKIPEKLAIDASRASKGDVVANPEPGSPQAQALDGLRALLMNSGHDAVVYNNEFEGGGDSYILLDPSKATQRQQEPAAPVSEPIVADQAVETPDVAAGLNQADEVRRLSGTAPEAPAGPITTTERQSMREFSRKEIEVNSVISALASVANNANIDLGDTAKLKLEKTDTGYVLRSETGTDLTLTSQDVKNLRYADLGTFRKSGLGNYLKLKLDTAGVTFRGKKYSPHFRRTKSSKLSQDLMTEVLRTINSARVGVHTKLEILNTQWEKAHGQQLQDAPKEQLELFNAHLTGNLSLEQLQQEVELTPEMVRSLKSLRQDIDVLSKTMVTEGMIDNELAFQIDKNMGTYLRVQYALKDVEARLQDPDALINLIPEEKRNRVANALTNAYLEPAWQGQLHKLPRASLKRLASLYGLTSSKVVGSRTTLDEEGNEVPRSESQVIVGTSIDIDRAKVTTIAAALQQKLTEKPVVPADVMLRFLQGEVGGAQASMHGREKSAERARTLSRTDEQLKKEGYTDAEIVLNNAFRSMLAEHIDPITTVQQTVNTMLNHVASHRIVNALTQLAPTGAVSMRSSNESTGATQQLVASGDKWADVRVVDPVTGESIDASQVFVRPEVKLAFDRLVRPNFSDGLLTNVYRTAQAVTKINLTALNAGSHFRNIRSSLEIAATRGYLLNPNMVRTMRALRGASSVAAHDIEATDQQWSDEALDSAAQYLTKLGILHDSVRTGSIKELLQRMSTSKDVGEAFEGSSYLTASGRTLDSAIHELGKARAVRGAKQKLVNTPLGAYRLEDEGPKILAFLQERELVADMMDRTDLVEVMRGDRRPNDDERAEIKAIDRKASKKIRNLFPTYSSVPEFVKDLSVNLFATPFPSFNAEMIRNWAYDIRDIADMAAYVKKGDESQANYYHGMNKSKVAIRLTERLWSWSAMGAYYAAMLSSVGTAFGWMLSLPFGATPDDEDEVTKNARELTEKMADHGYVPGKAELDAYDPFFRALLPGWGKSNLYRIVDFEPGKSITVMDMSYTMPYSQITQLSVNLGGAVGALIEGDTAEAARAAEGGIMKFIGEWSAKEPLMDAVLQLATGKSEFGDLEGWERTDALVQMITPGSQSWKSLTRLVAPADDPHEQDLSDFVLGQRPFTMFFDKSYVNAIWPEKLNVRTASVKTRDLIREAAAGKVTDDEFRKRYQDYEEDRIQAMAQIEFINHSSDILGFNKSQRRKAIAQSTLTGDNQISKSELVDGKWRPLRLTPSDIYPQNQRPDGQTTREYNRLLRLMREVQRENNWR